MNRKPSSEHSAAGGRPGGVPCGYTRTASSFLLVLILGTMPVWAALGQPEASVASDQLRMKSEDRVQSFDAYKVHELNSADGTVVREYVSTAGPVFGVAWHGRSTPDMNQLLGTYINNLQTATREQTQIRQRRGITVKTGDLVYTNFCHMQVCNGSAYAPKLIPSSVSAEVIR